jgi:hypothetical protein
MAGPEGTKLAKDGHKFVTFDLAITNRTDSPQSVGESQLAIPGAWGEDTAVERGYEPHSFLSRSTPIAPGETALGTLTFQMSTAAVENLAKEGNLDIDNFGPGDSDYAPEEVFTQPELGVMRTYGPASSDDAAACFGVVGGEIVGAPDLLIYDGTRSPHARAD